MWLADLTASGPAEPLLHAVQEGVDARTGLHVGRDGRLCVFTDAGAPRDRLAVADPAHPEPDRWRDLIGPDPTAILNDCAILDGTVLDGTGLDRPALVVSWTRHAVSEITVHDLATGERTGTVPAYSASILAWVEAGGVYAIAALRGGGEEGEDWHRAGMREHKQAVFDDFHAAAEALIAGGWTTPVQLGISGGSNGGLLAGAALPQRPDRYRAVVCSAPLLDMVRYERFGLGQTWNDEYGTAADPVELGWLLGYSPYHRVRPARSTGHPVHGVR